MTSPTPHSLVSSLDTEARFDTIDELHRFLRPTMRAIAEAVGPHCEVVLHDLTSRELDHTIHDIINGHVTGRSIGGPSTNLGIDVMKDRRANHDSFGYRARTVDGRELHSSSVYFHNFAGDIIASLCINVDLTPLQAAVSQLNGMLPQSSSAAQDAAQEVVGPDISSVLDDLIDGAVAAVGKLPSTMVKADRVRVMRILEERGAFHIKRAVDQIAKTLGISRVTAYNYLDEIRNS